MNPGPDTRTLRHWRRPAVWAVVAAGLWVVGYLTGYRTACTIRCDGERVVATVAGVRLEAAARLGPVRRITVRTAEPVEPMVIERFTVARAGAPGQRVAALEGRLRFAGHQPRPAGDWHLDDLVPVQMVAFSETLLTPPFDVATVFRGRTSVYVTVRLEGDGWVELHWRRGLINHDAALLTGNPDNNGAVTLPGIRDSLLGMATTLAHWLLAAALLILAASVLAARRPVPASPPAASDAGGAGAPSREWVAWIAAAGIACLAFVLYQAVSRGVLEGVAHTPDEVTYLQQAKWLLAGEVAPPAPAFVANLPIPFTTVTGGRWRAMYPVGWPAVLAVGEAAGAAWVVAPVCGALFVFVLFLIGRELYGAGTGVAAQVFAVLSPATTLVFSSFLSHALGSLLIGVAVWLLVRGWRSGSSRWLLLGGVSLGYAAGVRPATAALVLVTLGCGAVVDRARRRQAWTGWSAPATAVGILVGSMPWLAHNLAVTGRPLAFAYGELFHFHLTLANLPVGVPFADATMAYLSPAVFGWGWPWVGGWVLLAVPMGLALVPVLVGRRAVDLLLASLVVLALLPQFLLEHHGLHGFGPRHLTEVFFALFLLVARGVAELARRIGPADQGWRTGRAVQRLPVLALAVLLALTAAGLPIRLPLCEGYNNVDGRLNQIVAATVRDNPVRARVLVVFPAADWLLWGAVAPALPRTLEDGLVFASSTGVDADLLRHYAGRSVFLADRAVLRPRPTSRQERPPGGPSQ